MGWVNLCVCVALAFIALSAADSDEAADLGPSSEESQRASFNPMGFLPSFLGSGSGRPDLSALLSNFMSGSGSGGSAGLADFLSMFGNAMNSGSRSRRAAEEDGHAANNEGQEGSGHGHEGPQDRLFFSSLFRAPDNGIAVPCNFTTQAGSTCLSCTQALTCRSNNAGVLRTCRGIRPFCNGGTCSRSPGPQCFNTTATTG